MSAARLHWSRNLQEVGAGITGGEPGSSEPAADGTALGIERLRARVGELRTLLQAAEDDVAAAEAALHTRALLSYTRTEIAAAMSQGKRA